MKPLAVIKNFFAPDVPATEMKTMLEGFKRPLREDPDFVELVNLASHELKVNVEWDS